MRFPCGVKDAYVIPCASATEQKSIMQRLAAETRAQKVPVAWLERALSMALGDGLANGTPPAPGLIEVAGLCGLTSLRPEPTTTEALIAGLDAAPRIAALSAQARGKLINASEGWWDRHEVVRSWFEESDSAHELLDQPRSPRALESALWAWLETRRGWWARIVAHGADMLEAAGHPDAASFAATAMALMDGRDLKKIPVMADVHEQTIEAWVFDDPDATLDELAGMAAVPEPPQTERTGELAKLLKGAALSADWIDGYLMAIVLAPKIIAPNRWVPEILNGAMEALGPITIQRFIDIVMMRVNATVAQACDSDLFASTTASRPKLAMRDWAAGFTLGCKTFRSSWPAKAVGPDDHAMRHLISDAVGRGFSATDLGTLGQWIAARHASNKDAGESHMDLTGRVEAFERLS